MSLSTSTRRAASAALIGALALLGLTACGGDTWEGSTSGDVPDAMIGDWKGDLEDVTVECSGDPDGDVTITLTSSDKVFTATLHRPDGEVGTVTVTGPDDRAVTWDEKGASTIPDDEPDIDSLPHWGPDLTVTTPGDGELSEAPGGGTYFFDLQDGRVSCAKGD